MTSDAAVAVVEDWVLWVDPETGAIVEPGTEGAEQLDKWDVQGPAGCEEQADQEDFSWVPAWYLKRMGHVASERSILKAQYKAMMARLDNIERHLRWRWSEVFAGMVEETIASEGGKKKSVNYLEGKAGFRTVNKVDIFDEDLAKDHCREKIQDAVRVKEDLMISQIPKDVEVPGIRRWQEEKFYAKGNV